jgi:hypothetical protein
MMRLTKLPSAFERYEEMLGVLDFAVVEGANGDEEEILSTIPHALQPAFTFNAAKLRSLGYKRISERTFFGDWYALESGKLLKLGDYRTADGSKLQNPKLESLDSVKILSGASTCPDPGSGGNFAYAFSNPPYGLNAQGSDVQTVFEEIRDFILPPALQCEICDWSSPRLPEVSDYFADGMEWWGVFLFSVYIPALSRLTVVAGSTTD